MVMALSADWTVERVRALPDDGNRYEVIDGVLLVTPSPSYDHQAAATLLRDEIMRALGPEPRCFAFAAPVDIEYGPRTMVEPDVSVVPLVNGRRPRDWHGVGELWLAVEILSRSTKKRDRTIKRDLYLREHVGEYWIVDLGARLIERWRPGNEQPEVVRDVLWWTPPGATDAARVNVAGFFEDVLDR